jgi:trans-2,3-dihydro-3-hydroxyanthranilate isomerase
VKLSGERIYEMVHQYILADVFTEQRFGGNQLAVFPEATGIATEVMPKIAGELNLSETVFVLPPAVVNHTCQLRIFTPAMELPFAGHPTVGTACILAAIGQVQLVGTQASLVFEEGVGPVSVCVERVGQGYGAQFEVPQNPVFGPPGPPPERLAQLLGVSEEGVVAGVHGPKAVSCGAPFLFITVRDPSVLERVRLNRSVWEEVLSRYWAPHVYVVAHDHDSSGSLVRARMFAPAMGILEDPATGAAASALPGYLGTSGVMDGLLTWRIEQGLEMGRPSRIDVEAEVTDGVLRKIRVGGSCVIVGKGDLDLGA